MNTFSWVKVRKKLRKEEKLENIVREWETERERDRGRDEEKERERERKAREACYPLLCDSNEYSLSFHAVDTLDHARHILCHLWSCSGNLVLCILLIVCALSHPRKMGCQTTCLLPSLQNHTMCCSGTDCDSVHILCHVRVSLHYLPVISILFYSRRFNLPVHLYFCV